MSKQKKRTFPIFQYITEILRSIGKNPVTGVIAPTGTGKSIAIPLYYIRENEQRRDRAKKAGTSIPPKLKIFIAVPTRAAAISLSEYQKQNILRWDVFKGRDITVGFAAEGVVKYTDKDSIVYVTSGHMVRKLLRLFKDGKCLGMTFTDVLVIDEIHLGLLDNTMIYSLWKKCEQQLGKVPHVLLTSATFDPKRYPELSEIQGNLINLDDKLGGKYKISISYQNKDYKIGDETLYNDIVKVIKNYNAKPTVRGHFLIFVTGRAEVELIKSKLGYLSKAIVLGVYSALPREEINKIFAEPPQGIRKIVIATNIAETSITISNIGVVIDSMLERRVETSNSDGLRLKTHYISKSSAKQRTGRTGRTMDGESFRMMTQEKYNILEEQRPEEIEKIPIYRQIIDLLNIGLNPINILSSSIRPNYVPTLKGKIDNSIKLLKQLQLVDNSDKTTEIGKFISDFPLSVRNATILWHWISKKYPTFPGIVVVTLIDTYGPPYFWTPSTYAPNTSQRNNHIGQYFQKFRGISDVHTFLNIWSNLMNEIGGPAIFRQFRSTIKNWSVTNSMNNKQIIEILNKVSTIINKLKQLRIPDYEIGPFATNDVIKFIQPIAASVYSDMMMELKDKQGEQLIYKRVTTNDRFRLDSRNAVNDLNRKEFPTLIGLVTAQFERTNIITVALNDTGHPLISGPPSSYPKIIEKTTQSTSIVKFPPQLPPTAKFLPLLPQQLPQQLQQQLPPKLPILTLDVLKINPFTLGNFQGKKSKI